MQLLLPITDEPRVLAEIHQRLIACFGRQGPYLQLDPVSQLVMGLIGGKTHSEISATAFLALWRRFGGWEAVRDAQVAEIQETIGGVTFAERKAPRLKAALAIITRFRGRLSLDHLQYLSVDEAMEWLEQLPGVGRKVAAATLNFSSLRRRALVIDTHHLRVLRRLNIVGGRCAGAQAYDHVVPMLPREWSAADFDEHHQLMKALGQAFCRSDVPLCRRCPLQDLCPGAPAQPAAARRGFGSAAHGRGWRQVGNAADPVRTPQAVVGAASTSRPVGRSLRKSPPPGHGVFGGGIATRT